MGGDRGFNLLRKEKGSGIEICLEGDLHCKMTGLLSFYLFGEENLMEVVTWPKIFPPTPTPT